jgi:hypothetical protein
MKPIIRRLRRGESGQILPLVALMFIVLIGLAALAIDVSNAYQARRTYRAFADAASLAGAQDLKRAVTTTDYDNARADAIQSIRQQFEDPPGSGNSPAAPCTTIGNRSDCTLVGLPYAFSVITPLPSAAACVTCDPLLSVQVTFSHPTFGLSFARILGQSTWNVGATSVAGLEHAKAYTIVTLRPPSSETIPGVRDIYIEGGTEVIVSKGDVGTNANMLYNGTDSVMELDPGYRVYYYDPTYPPLWGTDPISTHITDLILDPMYPIPTRPVSTPTGTEDVAGCGPIAAVVLANPNYAPSVPVSGGVPDMTHIHCYTKGIYGSGLDVSNGDLAILEPGLYFFDDELDVQGSLIGGYTPNSEGVALVFRESQGTEFKNRTSGGSSSLAQIVALNAGDKYLNPGGREATPARDYSGGFVQTNTTPAKIMTLIVQRDSRCPVVFPYPSSCGNVVENANKAIDLSGGSGLYLAGVQYAPSDNVTISGNASTDGYAGQVWAWTIKYTGGSLINQEGDQEAGPGTLRLDAACTAPGTNCIP